MLRALRDETVSQTSIAQALNIPREDLNDSVFGLVLTPLEGEGRSEQSVASRRAFESSSPLRSSVPAQHVGPTLLVVPASSSRPWPFPPFLPPRRPSSTAAGSFSGGPGAGASSLDSSVDSSTRLAASWEIARAVA